MPRAIASIVAGLICFISAGSWCRAASIEDIFGRDLTVYGIVVPDWEGYMANPAIEFSISAPAGARLPAKALLAANDARLYFDLPSRASAQGPRKEFELPTSAPVVQHIAIFPARKKHAAQHAMAVVITDASGHRWQATLPVLEVPVESPDASKSHPILVDFSQDKTGFYRDPVKRDTFKQAVADWAYYLADEHPDPVPAGDERTWIFDPTSFSKSHIITNAAAYTGTLLYTYGISTNEIRSGGEPSGAGKPQTINGQPTPLHRSGGVEVEIRGNYNTLGWAAPLRDDEWWRAMNPRKAPSDLYSVVHHEMGHALFFNPNNKKFPHNGTLTDDAVMAYLGSQLRTDIHDHFDGFVDPISLHGAFGNEYHGKTPFGRWLITKLDLLAAQAVGYKLRPTAPFMPLTLADDTIPAAVVGKPYKAGLHATGGVPFYDFSITAGALPPGLLLNRFTGELVGTPNRVGQSSATIQVREYVKDAPPMSRVVNIEVIRR